MPTKLITYLMLMRAHRPIGTYLVLWPTLWALWIASDGLPDFNLLIIFILGAFLMRSAGCVINDYADFNIDGHVARTKDRPLITGLVTRNEALGLFACLCIVAFVLVLFTNTLTIGLAFGAVALAFCYPFMKRYTHFPQVVLGAAFAWAVPMAFSATTNTVPRDAWLIYLSVLVWTVCYDTFYAMTDREDDLKIGVKSTAVLFAEYDRVITAGLQIFTLVLWVTIGDAFSLGVIYFAAVAFAAGFFIYQQWLIRERDPQKCFTAFLNNNWVGIIILLGIIGDVAMGHPQDFLHLWHQLGGSPA